MCVFLSIQDMLLLYCSPFSKQENSNKQNNPDPPKVAKTKSTRVFIVIDNHLKALTVKFNVAIWAFVFLSSSQHLYILYDLLS